MGCLVVWLLVGLPVLLLVDDDVVFVVYFGDLLGW